MSNLFSIVIPVYNSVKLLPKCIDSIIKQKRDNIYKKKTRNIKKDFYITLVFLKNHLMYILIKNPKDTINIKYTTVYYVKKTIKKIRKII